MSSYIGIDLGTSGVKLLLVDETGRILAEAEEHYEILRPREGWTEQEPALWWAAVRRGVRALLCGQDRAAVRGIAVGGQMHGLVTLDQNGEVIRPCILWNDGRTQKQTDYLNREIGKDKLAEWTGNIAFAGFTAPKLLWMRENEPENFARIRHILLPKDYVVFCLCGNFSTDLSDAAGTLLLDVERRAFSAPMCDICGISKETLPTLHESAEVVGVLRAQVAEEFGLSGQVRVIAGAGDNAAAAIGTGAVRPGDCNISLGTSGTVFLVTEQPAPGPCRSLHNFCHANGGWHLLGCILSAAFCRKWWLEEVLFDRDYRGDAVAAAGATADGLYFLPYLAGERSPHNNVNARGAFIGLSATTTRHQMSRAVMEGVSFAILDCLRLAGESGFSPAAAGLCGGGARSEVWQQMMADVLELPIRIPATEKGPSYGAAMLAMVGCGAYSDTKEAADAILRTEKMLYPRQEMAEYYREKYRVFHALYPALCGVVW